MANPELEPGALLKGQPLAVTRKQRRADAKKRLDDAYADVDRRDAGYCWVTGAYTVPGAVSSEQRREHHHLRGRNVMPEWVFQPDRIITVRADVHQLITAGWLDVEGDDARQPIFFHWNSAFVKPGKAPFHLAGKRAQPEID